MFKKLLIVLFLFSSVFVGNSFAAELWKKYENTDPVRQEKIRAKMNETTYKQLMKALEGSTKNWQPITEQMARKMVNDGGKIWPITKCAEVIVNWWSSCDDWNWNKLPVPTAESVGVKWWDTWGKKQKKETCKYDPDGENPDIRDALEHCVWSSALVQVEDAYVTGGLKDVLNGWIKKIAGFLALGAIFAIAFGSLKLTLSMWEDEKIKKAKDIIKWWIIGFVAVISAGFLIAVVVNFIYSLAG